MKLYHSVLLILFVLEFSSVTAQRFDLPEDNVAYSNTNIKEVKKHLEAKELKEAEKKMQNVLTEVEKAQGKNEDYIELLYLQAKIIMHQWRTDEALSLYEETRNLAKQNKLHAHHSDAINALTSMYAFKEDFVKSEQMAREGIALPGLSQKEYSDHYSELSKALRTQEQVDSAIYYGNKSYVIDSLLKDSVSMPRTCHIQAKNFEYKGDFENAMKWYVKGSSYLPVDKVSSHAPYNYDIAAMLIRSRNLSKALTYVEKTISQCLDAGLKSNLAKAYTLRAEIFELEGKYRKAIEYYKMSDEANKIPKNRLTIIKNKLGFVTCKVKLGQKVTEEEIQELLEFKEKTQRQEVKSKIDIQHLVFMSQSNLSRKDFYKKYEDLFAKCQSSGDIYQLKDLTYLEYNFLSSRNEYQKANSTLESYYGYKNVINKEKQDYKILELEAQYDKNDKEKQIDMLANLNEVQTLRLKEQKVLIVLGASAILLISLLSYFIFSLYKRVSRQNNLISESLKEKEFLLREIHHRVKNNLQVISSLLSLQSRQIDNKDIQLAIKEGRSRVRSMALIHQNLYQNENLTGVSVAVYLNKLIGELFETYNIDKERIQLELDIDHIELDVDMMVPFGLIINELISNCLKHAFPNNRKGLISVKLKVKEGTLFLSIGDNGIGVDKSELEASKSFGNRLIKAFSKKLKADLEVVNDLGTTIHLRIKNYEKAK